ncbi:magnesium chelatase, partial [Patescibacteria group bacterium]|nr:magnesium chelatase [Patescibacteria group bacterium]
ARTIQNERFGEKNILTNSELGIRELEEFAPLSAPARNILNQAAKHMDLSPRAYHRVIKISRTIADLEGEDHIKEDHLMEALQYRPRNSL